MVTAVAHHPLARLAGPGSKSPIAPGPGPYQDHPVWVSWLDYPTLLRGVHWAPRLDGPGRVRVLFVGLLATVRDLLNMNVSSLKDLGSMLGRWHTFHTEPQQKTALL